MKTSNSHIPIYVVSLKRDTARRAIMDAHFAERGLAFEYLDATDARETPIEYLTGFSKPRGPWGMMRPHDMACTSSHLRAMEAFLETGDSHGLFCEDDIYISHDTAEWLSDLSWWPVDADVVKFERWRNDSMRIVLSGAGFEHQGRHIKRLVSRHPGCAGYLLTREAAQRILNLRPIDVPIDHLFFNPSVSPLSREMQVYQVQPGLIRQGNDPVPTANPKSIPQPLGANASFEREQGLAWLGRELRRGWYEVSRYPVIFWALLRGGSIEKPDYK